MSTIPREPAAADGAITVPGDVRRRRVRRVLSLVIGALAAFALFAVYLRLARTRAVNSDGSSQALQAWDILHGNLLLHGWILTDVSFYTTEIPEYMLVELVRGLGAGVVQISAAITYTLAVVLAALLAKGAATGREAAIRVLLAVGIMLAPQLDSGTNVLLSSPDHIGTSVPVMLAFLVLDRCRPRWWVPAVTFAVLAWAMVADELVLLVGVAPLIAVCALRAVREARGSRWREARYEAALALAAAAAVAAATGALRLIRSSGGFVMSPVVSPLAALHTILGHNLPVAGQSLLLLGGAYFPGLSGAGTWPGLAHVAGVALAAAGIGVTAWRFFRRDADRVSQLLLVGIAINVAAYAAGTLALNVAASREIAPVLPFAAALAGRQLGPWLLALRSAARKAAFPVLGLVLAGYVAGLGLELATTASLPQQAPLAAWLAAHPMGTGLSGYWESNVVTLTSGGRTAVRPVQVIGGRIIPMLRNAESRWYDPAVSRADFVVLGPTIFGPPGDAYFKGFTSRKQILATFGRPWRVYRFDGYTILRWRRNLLAGMR